ncbi:MAG: type II toxin-antitoxin system HicA family toxin [Patescibacteria group bacterium]
MPKLPVISAKKLIKVLKKKGFQLDRIHGSHYIFVHVSDNKSVAVPVHQGHDLGRGIMIAILKDADISTEEFLKSL